MAVIMLVYSLFDSSLNEFGSPYFFQTEESFKRSVLSLIRTGDKQNAIVSFPDDFIMYHLGSWDPKTGVFNLLSVPQSLGVVSSLLKSGNPHG